MGGKCYQDLEVWQVAMDLAEECYRATSEFPKEERYGLMSQMRRAVVSIAANIAEGQGRRYQRDFASFLSIANGSLAELETHVELSRRLHFIDANREASLLEKAARVGMMLNALIRSIEKAGRP